MALRLHSQRWRDIGQSLGFTTDELDFIEAQPNLRSTSDYISRMLSNWGQWVRGDARGSTGCATLESIKAALNEAGLGKEAQELKI